LIIIQYYALIHNAANLSIFMIFKTL
jgi:hypothetical protein